MSDYIPCPSTFEQLANELLLIVFEYLGLYFVYDGFFGLNQRFDSLLASNLLPPNILALCLYSQNDDSFRTFHNFFASRVFKLTIISDQPDYFYDLFNFPNVRLLRLVSPSDEQCEQVNLRTLPHLKHLQIRRSSEHQNGFCFNPCNVSHLHTICFDDFLSQIEWSEGDSILYALRSLTITTEESYDVYLKILARCPNLIRLQTPYCSNSGYRTHRYPILHLNLRQLIIGSFHDLSSKTLEIMLSHVPNITHLVVFNGLIDVQYDTLAAILTQYTMDLKVLQIALTASDSNREANRTSIQQSHPLYFHVRWHYPRCSRGRTVMTISSKKKCRWKVH